MLQIQLLYSFLLTVPMCAYIYFVFTGDSFNIENGTLVIKNIDKDVSGTYVCEAKNNLGRDTEAYEVEVLSKYYLVLTNYRLIT